ncbi:hypothetical protein Golax_020464 [Gossypium laxum]|uniref:Uncharacterized protein n=1 Tax=Gossypium laxum TaxID=34288 RepID=A0A7J9B100_9ROSI|nr:hypothetical protein [Gossypium laxum]
MVPLFLLELKYHGCQCVVYSVDILFILVSIVLRKMRVLLMVVQLRLQLLKSPLRVKLWL